MAVWLLPSLAGLITISALWLSLFVRGGSLFAGDGDVGRHVRVGTVILESGSIPRTDLFSHTLRGSDFVPYEWLSEVVYAFAHRLGGLAGVAVLASLLLAAAATIVYWICVRLGVSRLAAFPFALLALFLQAGHLLPRPHLFTTLFVAVAYLGLVEYRLDPKPARVLWLPLLFLVWANSHGGFLVGFILLFLFIGEALWDRLREGKTERNQRRVRTLGLVTGLCFGATLLNPVGPELWVHTTGYLRLDFLVDMTHEYQSPDFHDTFGKLFFVVVALGVLALMARRAPVGILGGTLFLVWLAFSLHSARNIPLFAVICIPWIAAWTTEALRDEALPGRRSRERLLGWSRRMSAVDAQLRPVLFTTVLAAALVVAGLWGERRKEFRFPRDLFPVEAVGKLDALGVDGNVFNEFRWGGYLLYAAYPEVPVFIDGQTDFYGEELTRDYLKIRNLDPEWLSLLDRYRVSWTLVPTKAPLSSALAIHPGWRALYADSTATVYMRRRAPPGPLPD